MDMVVQFSIIHKARTPCDHVFDHPLVQLMEDVGSNGEMDIAQRKPHPERLPDSTQHAALLAKLVEVSFRCCQVEGVQDHGEHGLLSMRGPWAPLTKCSGQAMGTCPILGRCHQALFRVICNIAGEDRKHLTYFPITSSNFHPLFPSLHQWFKHQSHRVMKKLLNMR